MTYGTVNLQDEPISRRHQKKRIEQGRKVRKRWLGFAVNQSATQKPLVKSRAKYLHFNIFIFNLHVDAELVHKISCDPHSVKQPKVSPIVHFICFWQLLELSVFYKCTGELCAFLVHDFALFNI